jgi:hypothetical protein
MIDVTNALIKEKFDKANIKLATSGSGNPGDTYLGKSISRQVVVESRLTGNSIFWDSIFAGVTYRWKGWEIKKPQVEEIVNEITAMFGRNIFHNPDLHETEEIQFYSVQLQVSLYQRALQKIYYLKDAEIQQIFAKYAKQSQAVEGDIPGVSTNSWANSIISDLRGLRKAYASGKVGQEEVIDQFNEIIEIAESQLSFAGFIEFVGGEGNMFVRGTIDGFRVGDEKGQQQIASATIGQIGALDPVGPLQQLQGNIGKNGIAGGEFFISWLINPL